MERQVLISMTEEELDKVVYNAMSKFWSEHLKPKEVAPSKEVKYITKKEAAKILRVGMYQHSITLDNNSGKVMVERDNLIRKIHQLEKENELLKHNLTL